MKPRLGELLLQMGVIDDYQLKSALAHQRQWGIALGRVLLERGMCAPPVILAALAQQAGLPAVDLDGERPPAELARLLPQKMAEKHRALALRLEGPRRQILVVAIAAPASLQDLDAIRAVSGKPIVTPLIALDDAIARAIARVYGDGPQARAA